MRKKLAHALFYIGWILAVPFAIAGMYVENGTLAEPEPENPYGD